LFHPSSATTLLFLYRERELAAVKVSPGDVSLIVAASPPTSFPLANSFVSGKKSNPPHMPNPLGVVNHHVHCRERELAAVKVSPGDVSLIATEMEVDAKVAERRLREAGGDVRAALTSFL
jgi:hypothetical protein